MFLTYALRECNDCGSIADTLSLIDRKLEKLSDSVYKREVYLTKSNNRRRQLKDLVYYKQILVHLALNSSYYTGFSYQQIVSKIKTLI